MRPFDQGEADRKVPLHKIPNVALGKVRGRHLTRMFFPNLWRAGESPAIPQETLAKVYNLCIRPTVQEVIPYDQGHWPVNYASALIQNKDERGNFHYPSLEVASNLLPTFGQVLLQKINDQEDLTGAFFLHELRGAKGGSLHQPGDSDEEEEALNTAMKFLDAARLNLEDWEVDVGLEIRHQGHVVQWLTSAHRRLLEIALPKATEMQITRLLDSKKRYHKDLSSQLKDLGGCRATPGVAGSRDGVVYINIYTTDKTATYQLHTGVFRRKHANDLLPRRIKKLLKDVEGMSTVFLGCAGDENWGDNQEDGDPPSEQEDEDYPLRVLRRRQEGCARFEIRVPLADANDVLHGFPHDDVQECCVSIQAREWW